MTLQGASRLFAITIFSVFFVFLTGLAGCSGQGEKYHPVKGKILVDQKPLTTGSIALHPDPAKGNTSTAIPSASISSDGTYEVFTNGKPGAPLGWYKVTVVAEETPDSAHPEQVKSQVATFCGDPATTPLALEVVAEPRAGAYDLQTTRK